MTICPRFGLIVHHPAAYTGPREGPEKGGRMDCMGAGKPKTHDRGTARSAQMSRLHRTFHLLPVLVVMAQIASSARSVAAVPGSPSGTATSAGWQQALRHFVPAAQTSTD